MCPTELQAGAKRARMNPQTMGSGPAIIRPLIAMGTALREISFHKPPSRAYDLEVFSIKTAMAADGVVQTDRMLTGAHVRIAKDLLFRNRALKKAHARSGWFGFIAESGSFYFSR